MNISSPLISVIMPVYNASRYLDEAIVSILVQSYDNFELLAINDGSTDNSLDILNKYAACDKRIRIITQENSGIVAVLNRGINEARGEFIARMDADDVSFRHRFEQQLQVFTDHPEAALVCGDFEVINEQSQFLYRELVPPLNQDIQQALFVRNPIAHGSVMFRKSIINEVGPYSDRFGPTEDLELWMRISEHAPIVGTGTTLYRWRVNMSGITMTHNAESSRRAKDHTEQRWTRILPATITRQSIVSTSRHYFDSYPDFGHYYKVKSLEDRAQIATKFIRNGQYSRGAKELVIIASTGRSGLRAVTQRLSLLAKVYANKFIHRGENND